MFYKLCTDKNVRSFLIYKKVIVYLKFKKFNVFVEF